MQKYMLLLLTCCSSLTSASRVKLLTLSTSVLSYAIHFLVYLSQLEVEQIDLASQNHNFHTSPLIRTERVRTSHVLRT